MIYGFPFYNDFRKYIKAIKGTIVDKRLKNTKPRFRRKKVLEWIKCIPEKPEVDIEPLINKMIPNNGGIVILSTDKILRYLRNNCIEYAFMLARERYNIDEILIDASYTNNLTKKRCVRISNIFTRAINDLYQLGYTDDEVYGEITKYLRFMHNSRYHQSNIDKFDVRYGNRTLTFTKSQVYEIKL